MKIGSQEGLHISQKQVNRKLFNTEQINRDGDQGEKRSRKDPETAKTQTRGLDET
jgi:hypothetical protein